MERQTSIAEVMIHDSAIVEDGVIIGNHSAIWDNVHIRHGAQIGSHTTVGEKTYIAYDVHIGSHVKINAMVYICAGVTIEDMCMISAGVVFTNDRYPRSMNRELTALETSNVTEETLPAFVRKGATIGANATIGPGLELGPFSMVGMGAVVTRNVPAQTLVVGNPARAVGLVCICGPRLIDLDSPPPSNTPLSCERCGRQYQWDGKQLSDTSAS
jgi:acetyltransferase-like isoleucine patch superfamily enzyme